jgi:hypothetical protein
MEDLKILQENLEYNKIWVYNNTLAMKNAIDDFINQNNWNVYLQVDYINEKFKLAKQYQKRVFQIEKDIKKFNK